MRLFNRQKSTERIKKIANQIYQNRLLKGKLGDKESDWVAAQKITKNPLRYWLFISNRNLTLLEKKLIEPCANWLDKADIFRIIEKIFPILEAIGVILIPIAVLIATQRYTEHQEQRDLQREENRREEDRKRLQQEAIKNYISQLSTIYLSTTGEMNGSVSPSE
ncbi:hypothetical protein HNI00_01625 [Thermoleptolyngbya oregonensis NK1-22]|uniref:Uncharacterized protein n=1 Tax=Thermoleptolyngbya oregonensis NK1-22 TaxID=2547457 RepID=A0AA96Y6N6_9CYAN|nr:hypothetical protein [Thermoleptolyngbya oregonensis]WOB42008.1 hypothetical protein HNI00_01625 [Thermoleptolyngbya oregonensis NK1-22]